MMLRMRRGDRGLRGCALGDVLASRGFGVDGFDSLVLSYRVDYNFIAGVSCCSLVRCEWFLGSCCCITIPPLEAMHFTGIFGSFFFFFEG